MAQLMTSQELRQRAFEIKYLIPPAQAADIRKWAREHLDPDPNANGVEGDAYQTTSIYFDTNRFDIFHRRGSFARVKYRIRRYDCCESAFLERKLKIRDTVGKRRSLIEIEDLRRLCGEEPRNGWPGFWFHRRLLVRQLKPVCQISYLRTARVRATSCGLIRLTLDQDIRTLPMDGLAFRPSDGGICLIDGHHILELKYHRQMPAMFKILIERFRLNPKPYSKYRTAAAALGYVSEAVSRRSFKGGAGASYA
jgi:hypothetical protein